MNRAVRTLVTGRASHIRWEARKLIWKVSGRTVVHLLHIGKTGGTAIADALAGHSRTSRYLIFKQGHRFTLDHASPGEKVIFFLRDPIDRFISAFYSRKRMGQPRFSGPWTPAEAEAFTRFETPDALGRALASSRNDEREAAGRGMRGIYHLKSSFWEWFGDEAAFRRRLDDVLLVGRQERLADDFERMKRVLDLPGDLGLPTDDVRAHRTPAGLDKRLSEEAVAALLDWYRDDYRFIRLCEELAGLPQFQSRWEQMGLDNRLIRPPEAAAPFERRAT